MNPQASNIGVLPELDRLQQGIAASLNTLAANKAQENQLEMGRQEKLMQLINISTAGMANRDASQINQELEKFRTTARDAAKKYQGNIPFDEYAKLNTGRSTIEEMVRKSQEDQKEYSEVIQYMKGPGSRYIDVKKSERAIQDFMNKPLMERGSVWEAVSASFDPVKYIKANANKSMSTSYVLDKDGKTVRYSDTNNPDAQIEAFMKNEDFREAMEQEYSLSADAGKYADATDYAKRTYGPLIAADRERITRNPSWRVVSSSGGGGRSTKVYTELKDNHYQFRTNPVTMSGLEIDGRAQTRVNVTEIEKRGNQWVAKATIIDPYYSFSDLKKGYDAYKAGGKGNTEDNQKKSELYESLQGKNAAEKEEFYRSLPSNPVMWNEMYREKFTDEKKTGGEERELYLSEADASEVLEQLKKRTKAVIPGSSSPAPASSPAKSAKKYGI